MKAPEGPGPGRRVANFQDVLPRAIECLDEALRLVMGSPRDVLYRQRADGIASTLADASSLEGQKELSAVFRAISSVLTLAPAAGASAETGFRQDLAELLRLLKITAVSLSA